MIDDKDYYHLMLYRDTAAKNSVDEVARTLKKLNSCDELTTLDNLNSDQVTLLEKLVNICGSRYLFEFPNTLLGLKQKGKREELHLLSLDYPALTLRMMERSPLSGNYMLRRLNEPIDYNFCFKCQKENYKNCRTFNDVEPFIAYQSSGECPLQGFSEPEIIGIEVEVGVDSGEIAKVEQKFREMGKLNIFQVMLTDYLADLEDQYLTEHPFTRCEKHCDTAIKIVDLEMDNRLFFEIVNKIESCEVYDALKKEGLVDRLSIFKWDGENANCCFSRFRESDLLDMIAHPRKYLPEKKKLNNI